MGLLSYAPASWPRCADATGLSQRPRIGHDPHAIARPAPERASADVERRAGGVDVVDEQRDGGGGTGATAAKRRRCAASARPAPTWRRAAVARAAGTAESGSPARAASAPRAAPRGRTRGAGGGRGAAGTGHERGRRGGSAQAARQVGRHVGGHQARHRQRAAELQRGHEVARRALVGQRRPRAVERGAPPPGSRPRGGAGARSAGSDGRGATAARARQTPQRRARRQRRAAGGARPARAQARRGAAARAAESSDCGGGASCRARRLLARGARAGTARERHTSSCRVAVDTSWTFAPACSSPWPATPSSTCCAGARARAEGGAARRGRLARRRCGAPGIAVPVRRADLADRPRSASSWRRCHMVQHLLLADLAPILLTLGADQAHPAPASRAGSTGSSARPGRSATPRSASSPTSARCGSGTSPRCTTPRWSTAASTSSSTSCFAAAGLLYWWHLLSPIRSRLRLGGMGPVLYMASTKIARRPARHRARVRARASSTTPTRPGTHLGSARSTTSTSPA